MIVNVFQMLIMNTGGCDWSTGQQWSISLREQIQCPNYPKKLSFEKKNGQKYIYSVN